MVRFLPIFLLELLLFPALVFGQSRMDCSALKSHILRQTMRYCLLLPSGYDRAVAHHSSERYPVLYFLHGLGENEQSLFHTGGWTLVDDLRQQRKVGDFLIVAPEGKNSFYINSAKGTVRYSDFFLREFMPWIETKYLVRRDRAGRGISGVSMGGYGALRFAFAFPELFSSVSAQSPALMTESPQELNAAFESRTPMATLMATVFGEPISILHWRQNDPFLLARRNEIALRRQAIYFNCGNRDEYDFEKGAQAFDRQLTAERVPHEFHLYPGDHSLNYFLEHLAETLEFHARAFDRNK